MTGLRVVGDQPERADGDAIRLLTFAETHREGFTYRDISIDLEWSRHRFINVVRRLREDLTDQAETLICNPDPDDRRGPWVYCLTDDTHATRQWHRNRLDDCETRLDTIVNVAASAMRAHDGRSRDGKRARILHRAARRAIEDLAELQENSA